MTELGYRNKTFKEMGESCNICNSEENVVAHHIDGNRTNNDLDNLIPLCRSCHGKVHSSARHGESVDRLSDQLPQSVMLDDGGDLHGPDVEKSHVEVRTDTRNRLRVWKAKRGMTYDEAVNELLDGYDGEVDV